MCKRKSIFGDNQGSSMILVIVCIGFISILCTLLMEMTLSSLRMKKTETRAKANFYTAEGAMDEIKAGLEEVVAVQLEEAYNQVIKQYNKCPEAEKKQIFAGTFIDGMTNALAENTEGIPDLNRYSIGLIIIKIICMVYLMVLPMGHFGLKK